MYPELLAVCAQNCKWSKPQPPATLDDIARAERALGWRFPEALKNLLSECNGDRWLLKSIDDIIETAGNHREYLEEVYPELGRNIFFADNGCGDCYGWRIGADGTADESVIFRWEHETNEYIPVASDISELIRRYYNDEI